MTTSACLVTSAPQFEPPQETAPQLIVATADPDTRAVLVADDFVLGNTPLSFSADVVSQDGPGRSVFVRLYIDYGSTASNGDPFAEVIARADKLEPGNIDDTKKRRAVARWFPNQSLVSNGCHTVTMMASHAFGEVSGCPIDATDYSQITWQILRCDSNDPNAPCDTSKISECLDWKRTCFSDAPDAGTLGAP